MGDSTKKHQVHIFNRDGSPSRIVSAVEQKSLLDNLIDQGVEIDHSCGGNGTCGTCCVQVVNGHENLSERSDVEIEMANDRGLKTQERLCCQTNVFGKISIQIE